MCPENSIAQLSAESLSVLSVLFSDFIPHSSLRKPLRLCVKKVARKGAERKRKRAQKNTNSLTTSIMRKLLTLFFGGWLLFTACSPTEETPDPSRLGYDFMPLEVGRYVDYDVFQVTYQLDQTRPDTQRYQLRELVADTLTTLNREKRRACSCARKTTWISSNCRCRRAKD